MRRVGGGGGGGGEEWGGGVPLCFQSNDHKCVEAVGNDGGENLGVLALCVMVLGTGMGGWVGKGGEGIR